MRRAYGTIAVVLAGAVALWAYSQKQKVGTWPTITDFWQTLLSMWRRQYQVITGTVTDLTNQIQGEPTDAITLAATLIAKLEGFSPRAYEDADGWSIGYGHFILASDPYNSSSVITESVAFGLLQQDISSAASCVESHVTAELTPNQEAALISFVYNVGCTAFAGSTLLSLLNSGDYAGASAQFGSWTYSQGVVLDALVNRRGAESDLFNA